MASRSSAGLNRPSFDLPKLRIQPSPENLRQASLFGEAAIFDADLGTKVSVQGNTLVVSQGREIELRLEPNGTLIYRVPLPKPENAGMSALMVIHEEDVRDLLRRGFLFTADLLDDLDPTQRLTHCSVAVRLLNADMAAWRPKGASFDGSRSARSFDLSEEASAVQLSLAVQSRSSLRHKADDSAEDLTTLLKRHSKWI